LHQNSSFQIIVSCGCRRVHKDGLVFFVGQATKKRKGEN
jgi:hypothetical protein